MSEIVTTAADQVVVDVANVPTKFSFNKYAMIGFVAGIAVTAGAGFAAAKLKEYKERKATEGAMAEAEAVDVKVVDTKKK